MEQNGYYKIYTDANGNRRREWVYITDGPNISISKPGPTPISGTPGPGGFGLSLSLNDIEAIIPQLQNVSSQLKEMWNSSMHSSLARIEDSWAGEDALRYTEKVRALDPRVNKMCQAIDLLAQTYQKVLDRSVATESDVAQKISSINSNY